MTESKLSRHSIAELANALRDGTLTAKGLTEDALAAHAQWGKELHAYKTWSPERARQQAAAADAAFAAGVFLGPLQGLPVSVKDLYGVAGYPTFAGTPRELPLKWELEGQVVDSVRRNLAVVTGKTHTVEFAFGGIGTNPHWGAPRNPWDESDHRAPGGSSSGAGVSLWEGSAVVALGTDTAGSVRIPASLTGTVGLKTTIGRWSTEGIVPLSRTFDTPGILTRTVADAVMAFAAIDPLTTEPAELLLAEFASGDLSDFRIGVCDWFFTDCEPGIAEAIEAAIQELASRGAKVERVELPEVAEASEIFGKGGLAAAEFATMINTEMQAFKDTLDPNVRARFATLESLPATEYLARAWKLEELSASVGDVFGHVDVLVGPTVPIRAPRLADIVDPHAYARANMKSLRNTAIANMLGLCALSMPVALDAAGMPVGMQIMGAHGEDERVLAASLMFELALGTAKQRLGRPPLGAG